jgi:hypothetical protein
MRQYGSTDWQTSCANRVMANMEHKLIRSALGIRLLATCSSATPCGRETPASPLVRGAKRRPFKSHEAGMRQALNREAADGWRQFEFARGEASTSSESLPPSPVLEILLCFVLLCLKITPNLVVGRLTPLDL